MAWAVGVDLGGTNVRAAQVDEAGSVGSVLTEPLDPGRSTRPFAQLIDMTASLIEKAAGDPPVGIGVGATGPVDPVRGVISNPDTLPGAYQGAVTQVLAEAFGVPVWLANDADAAALGEAWTGAGVEVGVLACLTIGTGIGVGVISGGQIFRGAAGSHPEAGHHVVDPGGPACYCGALGCVESVASGAAVLREALSTGTLAEGASAADVFAAADRIPALGRIVDRARAALCTAVLNLVAMHAPDLVVLTGNGHGDLPALVEQARQQLRGYRFAPPGVQVRESALGGLAGCVGAAHLAFISGPGHD
ncbi:MAG: ROK family protein [Streptosporangiaceae bacterium]